MMSKKGLIQYFIKILVLYGLLLAIGQFSHLFSPVVFVILCVSLAIPSAITLAYITVLKKTIKFIPIKTRYYHKDGWLSKLNKGKVFCITIAFFVSFISAFAIFLEIPMWSIYEWLAIILLLPLYFLVFKFVSVFLKKELKGIFFESQKLKWCAVIVPVIMCAIYFICNICFIPRTEYRSILDAFIAHENILDSSPSAFVAGLAKLSALFNAFYHFAISRFSGSFSIINILWNVVIYWSIFFTITNILNFFMIPLPQVKRLITPLTIDEQLVPETRVQKKYIFLPIFLVIFCIVGFLVLENYAKKAKEAGHLTYIENLVRKKIEVLAVFIDGHYYDFVAAAELIERMAVDSQNLKAEAIREIKPLINQSFDRRIQNVDSYLDWYYSFGGEVQRTLEMLKGIVTDNFDSFMAEKLIGFIDNGVNDAEWLLRVAEFRDRAQQLQTRWSQELSDFMLDDAIPEWLIQTKDSIDMFDFNIVLRPSNELTSFQTRLLVSAGAAAGTRVAAKIITRKLVYKMIQKTIIKKAVTTGGKIAAGAVIGTKLGTIVPGIGNFVGFIVGAAAGLGVDKLMLIIDETFNRESFHEELVESIEQQRQETLRLFN